MLPRDLAPDVVELWLDPEPLRPDVAATILRPYPVSEMVAREVSRRVNNSRNDTVDVLESEAPVSQPTPERLL